MPKAFVMINVKVGTDREVVSELKTFRYVDRVYEVYGVYDIVAEVQVSSMEELKETVNSDMRKLKNVLATNTIIVTGS
ncbi:MAG: Lrp/AsnC family transcriptional regulator [Thaumarchaeota archaeon]|nr:Lrp/AsnC family transcriptional regulator [Nitrososphaerota archaeon]